MLNKYTVIGLIVGCVISGLGVMSMIDFLVNPIDVMDFDDDFGVGEYNNEMKKLLGTLVKDPTERLVGQIPKLIFEDHLEFSQFKFNKDFKLA